MPELAPRRTVSTVTTTTVRYLSKPFGRDRQNPPSLGDLRTFVSECEGLPDDLAVRIDKGHLDEGGRSTVTFEVVQRTPHTEPGGAE